MFQVFLKLFNFNLGVGVPPGNNQKKHMCDRFGIFFHMVTIWRQFWTLKWNKMICFATACITLALLCGLYRKEAKGRLKNKHCALCFQFAFFFRWNMFKSWSVKWCFCQNICFFVCYKQAKVKNKDIKSFSCAGEKTRTARSLLKSPQ